VHLDAFREPGRPETPPGPDAPSITSIARTNWQPMVIVSPIDSVAATRTYAVNYIWSDATARQRGQSPTPVSSLELTGGSEMTQMWESLASAPIAFAGGVMILPRMITHSPTREVRYFPEQYWRAPADTLRKPLAGTTEEAPASPAAAPAGRPETQPK
jgi:hypothetical protein